MPLSAVTTIHRRKVYLGPPSYPDTGKARVMFSPEVPVRLTASVGGSRWGTHMPGSRGLPLLLGEGCTDRHGETSHTVESRSNEMPVYDCWGGRDGWCQNHMCVDLIMIVEELDTNVFVLMLCIGKNE
jgi:hypothetical protein